MVRFTADGSDEEEEEEEEEPNPKKPPPLLLLLPPKLDDGRFAAAEPSCAERQSRASATMSGATLRIVLTIACVARC